jgi:tRNA(Ile)-lysidine synthetase-like protein
MTLKLGPITQYSKLLLFYRLNYSMTGFIPILNQENNSTEKLNISHNLSEKFNLEKKINISDTLSQPSLLQSIVERYKKSLHLFSTVENLKLQHPSLLNYIVETKILEASFVSINDLKNRFEYLKIRPATPAVVALSGGADSLCLWYLSYLSGWFSEVIAVTVDHNLRSESCIEAKYLEEVVNYHGGRHYTLLCRWEPEEKINSELSRNKRYDLLSQFCAEHSIETLLVAHQADDQVETLLLRYSKGSSLYGLSCMQAYFFILLRKTVYKQLGGKKLCFNLVPTVAPIYKTADV